ncbi:hypothetical protein Clacol_000005 [Clathrus columnatus]|uniref:Tyrosyl-DNA phosphodiesterase n=1 Tax=Clathrus columnatus TaxID=1419009 RepID=A0AAV4ZZK6_9AGAM|nr:hypothetical protein Clacol_000005 [Clathrus columnatus]
MNSDDEDLKLMEEANRTKSRLQTNKKSQREEPIIISSDEEDQPQATVSNPALFTTIIPQNHNHPQPNAFLSQRAQLEAERLARSQQRMAQSMGEASPSKTVTKRKPDDEEDPFEKEISHSSTKKSKFSVSGSSNNVINSASSSSSKATASGSSLYFWDGELRQTANAHVEHGKDKRPVFRLNEILGEKSDLSFAILSAYVTQVSWIYSLMPQDIPVILVGQPDATGTTSVHNILPHWVRVTPFLRGGRGCMHIKLLLLFYKSGRLRIVIPTANFVDYDWRDIENSVWLQDVPLRKESIPHDAKAEDFPAQLGRVLHYIHVPEGLRALRVDHPNLPFNAITDLRTKWDFSEVHSYLFFSFPARLTGPQVRVQLVPSIAGKFEGWPAVLRFGHTRLMKAIRQIGARADPEFNKPLGNGQRQGRKLLLECQTSSIGTYTPAWIEEFYLSACGASPEKWLDEGKTKRSKRLDTLIQNDGWRSWKQVKVEGVTIFIFLTLICRRFYFQVYTRSETAVWEKMGRARCSVNAANGPGQSSPDLFSMTQIMILGTFEYASSQGNSASKVLSSKNSGSNSSSDDETEEVKEVNTDYDTSLISWLYVGSHNFTPSAWGNLSGTGFSPVMNVGIMLAFNLSFDEPVRVDHKLRTWRHNTSARSAVRIRSYLMDSEERINEHQRAYIKSLAMTCAEMRGSISRIRLHTPRDKVTTRRPRRLRKRRPANPYKNDLVTTTKTRYSVLDISPHNSEKKDMWDWDSCSTFEPSVEILNYKEEGLDDHESDSTHPELIIRIREAYEYDFLFPGLLSNFIPHVLETIEEVDVECPSIRGRVEALGRPDNMVL